MDKRQTGRRPDWQKRKKTDTLKDKKNQKTDRLKKKKKGRENDERQKE